MVNKAEFDKPLSKAERKRAAGKKPKPKKPLRERIPVPPPLEPMELTNPGKRGAAAVALKLNGASFHEIAQELGYADAKSAEVAYVSALATMHPMSSWETLRQEAALRAEMLLRRSLAMSQADYLVDRDNPDVKLPNPDRLRWHEQAGKDLNLLVNITGAKAPARLEVSASTQELNQMVNALLVAQGGDPEIEADVFDIGEIEAIEADIVEEE